MDRMERYYYLTWTFFFPVTLPKIQYDIETNNYTVHQSERSPLELSENCPVSTTCMVFDEWVLSSCDSEPKILNFDIFLHRKTIFADPDAEEEELANTLITIGSCNGELCLVNKAGGQSIAGQQFDECLKLALNREKSICKLISSILKEP